MYACRTWHREFDYEIHVHVVNTLLNNGAEIYAKDKVSSCNIV